MNPDNYYNFPPDWDEPDYVTITYDVVIDEDGVYDVEATLYPNGVVEYYHPITGELTEDYDGDRADAYFDSGTGSDPDYRPGMDWD